jgi:UDP-N-acetylglucosamine 2-epimerase (non-hydrolysing)
MTFYFMVIVGTRPEIIKMAPLIREIKSDPELSLIFIHSGQHYDYGLSQQFIEELELPTPDLNFKIGSGTHAEQTSQMLEKFEQVICDNNPDVVLVEGDTNTVLAAGLASVKLHVPLGHVEAGIRSFDRTMPEEINRRIAAVVAELHFAPSERAAINLLYEGVQPNKIFITGNTIVDACFQHIEIAQRESIILDRLGLSNDELFATVTVHRAENVDNKENLTKIVKILLSIQGSKLIFLIHPRTRKNLKKFKLMEQLEHAQNIVLSEPIGYLDFLRLLSGSVFVLTDSGGIQEEAITLKIPCITLRNNTERPETIEIGANKLVGLNNELILKIINKILNNPNNKKLFNFKPNPYGHGDAGKKIIRILKSACNQGLKVPSSRFLKTGSASYQLLNVHEDMIGKTIKEIFNEKKQFCILIYDTNGNPVFPRLRTVIQDGWRLVIFKGS